LASGDERGEPLKALAGVDAALLGALVLLDGGGWITTGDRDDKKEPLLL
jgi:hypothetical protein